MTLLGKVFTGLVLFLSLMFFTFSVVIRASHTDQKALAAEYDAQARASQTKNTELAKLLEAHKADLALEQTTRRSALAALQVQLEQGQTDIQTKEAELASLRTVHTQLIQNEKSTQEDLIARTAENEKLREKTGTTREERDQKLQQLLTITDQMNRLQGQKQSLEGRVEQLTKQ